jgi:GNAT superfamily N-acetyltransferase
VSKPAETPMDKVMENQEIAQEAPLAGEISLRRVGPADTPFLLELYGTTRQQELALVPWDEAQKSAFITMQFTAQQQHYANHYPHATHDVILRDGEPSGQIYVARDSEKIHIIDLVVAPPYRNAGIGTSLIQGLLEEARLTGVRCVFMSSRRALRCVCISGWVFPASKKWVCIPCWSGGPPQSRRKSGLR